MFNKLKSKLKSMRNAKTSAVAIEAPIESPDHIVGFDDAPHEPMTIELNLDADYFIKQVKSLKRQMRYWQSWQRYRQSHLGMTSYQKWHKSNKKWRG